VRSRNIGPLTSLSSANNGPIDAVTAVLRNAPLIANITPNYGKSQKRLFQNCSKQFINYKNQITTAIWRLGNRYCLSRNDFCLLLDTAAAIDLSRESSYDPPSLESSIEIVITKAIISTK